MTQDSASCDGGSVHPQALISATRECPPTCDTRLARGPRVACEAAGACKQWRIESGLSITRTHQHTPKA